MLVWRLEDDNGLGYYSTPTRISYVLTNPNARNGYCPVPSADGLLSDARNTYDITPYRFGFATLCDMRAWFNDWRTPIPADAECTLGISVYEVAPIHVQFGGHQVIFNIKQSTLVKRFQLRREHK